MNIMKKISFLLIGLVVFLSSCVDDTSVNVFDGVASVYFTETSLAALLTDDGVATTQDVPVTATLAGIPGSEVSLNFSVDESSTAVEGVHYSLASTSVTLPEGEFTATINVTGLIDGFGGDPDSSAVLILNVISDQVESVAGSDAITLNLGITCPSEIPLGTYTTSIVTGDPTCNTSFAYADEGVEVTFDEETGLYRVSDVDFGYFVGDYVAPTTFRDVCNNLTLLGASDAPYGISFVGSGVFVPGGGANGTGQIVFQCYYDATYAGPGAVETVAFDAP